MRKKIKHKLYKVLGKSKLYETRYGIKVINPVHLRGQIFEYTEETLNPSELCLGCDALNDEYTMVGTPIPQSPHYDFIRLLNEDKSIDNCDYIIRKMLGALDGRDRVELNSTERDRHYTDFVKCKDSLLNNNYLLPIVYKVEDKYYIYDGKHHAATASLLGLSIRCKVIDLYSYARDIYSNIVFNKMKVSPNKYSKNLAVLNKYINITPPKCLVVNRCRTDNEGDQAIGLSMCRLLSAVGVKCDLTEFSRDNGNILIDTSKRSNRAKKENVKQTVIPSSLLQFLRDQKWKLQSNNLFQRLRLYQYDYIFIGGGEIIQSNGQFPLALYEWCKKIKKYQSNARIILFAIGATASYTKHDEKLVRTALDLVDTIYVRDVTSQKNLKSIFNKDSKVIPDVVFINSPDTENPMNTKRSGILYGITDPKRILRYGLIANNTEAYFEYCFHELCKLKEEYPVKDFSLFYTTKSDRDACLDFQEYVMNKHSFKIDLQETNDLKSLMRCLQNSNIVVSPRMHGCILSCIAGCECHPVLMSNKMKSFNEILNQGINLAEKRNLLISAIRDIIQK